MPFDSLSARAALHRSWAATNPIARTARTAAARAAQQRLREQAVDPEGQMTPEERAKAAEYKRKADLLAMSLKARAKRLAAKERAAAEADAVARAQVQVDQDAAIERASDAGGVNGMATGWLPKGYRKALGDE